MELRTVGIVHLCPGAGCAVCRWVARRIYQPEAKLHGRNAAKVLDAAVGIAKNKATRSSAETEPGLTATDP
jgi:hypothetical protein